MITITQGVKVQVNAANVAANWVAAKNAWVATIPTQISPTYVATVLSADVSGVLSKTIQVIQTANAQAVKVTVVNGASAPAAGIVVTAYYQGVALANNGIADSDTTGPDGTAILFLDAGVYNLLLQSPGFQDELLQTLQIANAVTPFDGGGSKLESHILKDNSGNPVASGLILVRNPATVPSETSLVAARATDGAGAWTANLFPALYKFTEGKVGFDSVIAEVTIVG